MIDKVITAKNITKIYNLGKKNQNKVIKNSKFKIIENSGHEVNVDNPKKLARVIYDFWKDKDIMI